MTKRVEKKIVKANHQKLYLKTWASEKARGVSLSAFFRSHGLAKNDIRINVAGRLTAVR